MPTRYKYKAIDRTGSYHTGVASSESREAVADLLSSRSLYPVTITEQRSTSPLSVLGFFRRAQYEDLIVFTNSLATMYRAGVPLLRALSLIRVGSDSSRFNTVVEELRRAVQSGKSLSQGMAEYSEIFSPVYVSCIAAGEESGKLDDLLEELSDMLEQELEISRLLKSGLRYPAIVLTVISAAFVVLMTYVIPKFVTFYGAFEAELPLPTRMMIGISTVMTTYWPALLVCAVLGVLGYVRLVSTQRGRLFVDRMLLKIPIISGLIIKGNIARFAMMFRILFKSGLPIIRSLAVLTRSVKNTVLCLEIERLRDVFNRGGESELAAESFEFLPSMARHMIAIGLESGSLETTLYETATHYGKEVQYTSRHLTAILEPILTVVVSIFVLLMALAIFLPMWNLIKVFGS